VKARLSRAGYLTKSISAITVLAAATAQAQEAAIEEILVTAQRRAESVQDVPLAVSAFSEAFVRERNLDDVKDLVLFTPGITGNSQDSFIDTLSVRGILTNDFGVGGDPSVGVFKNNIYQGRNGAVVTSLYDVERAEVLRGPQGFLFGRNSIGGAISVFTRRPEFERQDGYVELDVGERGRFVLEGAMNVPVSDSFALRIAGYHSQEDGFVEDQFAPANDDLIEHDKDALRVTALWRGERTDVNFMVEYEDRNQSGSMYRATQHPSDEVWADFQEIYPELALRGGKRDVDSDLGLGEADDSEILSLELTIDRDLGFATLSSITGFKDHDYDYAEDFDGTPLRINDYRQDQSGDYFETELRLVSQGDDPLSWYGGVSVYRENIDATFTQGQGEEVWCNFYIGTSCSDYFAYYGYVFTPTPEGMLERNQVKGEYWGWAAYVDLTYAFTDRLDASLGVRYTYDEKDFKLRTLPVESELGPAWALGFTTIGYLQDTQDWDHFTPRAQVRFRPNETAMLYASVTRGYKSGGFGSFAINPDQPFHLPLEPSEPVGPGEARPDDFDPETSWSYEVGTKLDLLDRRMRLDVAAYYYTYEDLQVTVGGVGGGIVVDNVGKADGWGIESTLQWIVSDYVDLYLAGAWADSEVDDAEALCDGETICDGSSLPQLPEFSGSAVVEVHHAFADGELRYTAEVFGQTRTYGGLLQLREAVNDAYADLTLRVGYRATTGWSATAYVENVTNEIYFDGVAESGSMLPAHWFGPARPRTWGLKMNWEF
jgi:iron complex outermembrane receptor protein